jgi:hypothetical protein
MITRLINKISKLKTDINIAKIESVKNDYALLTENKKVRELKDELKADKNIIRNSYVLFVLGILGLLASTSLSLFGGIDKYHNFSKYAFIIALVFIQVSIFVVSAYESVIINRFHQHYILVKTCQMLLLVTSIKFNYDFFKEKSVFTFFMCVILDCITIKFITMSYDFRHLLTKESIIKSNNILKMWIDNKMFGIKSEIINQYELNNNLKIDVETIETYVIPEAKEEIKQIEAHVENEIAEDIEIEKLNFEKLNYETSIDENQEQKTNYQYNKKTLDIENIRKYHNYILGNLKDGNVIPGIKTTANKLGLTQGEAMRIYYKLRDKKYLETKNRTTKIKKKKFIESDFVEV